jgi:hypothetical protein
MDDDQMPDFLGLLDVTDTSAMVMFGPDGMAQVLGLSVDGLTLVKMLRSLADRMERDITAGLN